MATAVSRSEARERLTGPIASICVPFQRDGSIDFAGLRSHVEFCIGAGSPTVLLTYGDSLFSVLADREVGEVTRVVAEQAAGRAMVVAADRAWWTGETVRFAREARELGADVLMVLPPDWGASCTPESLVAHYAAAAGEIPVMVVTGVFIPRGIAFALQTLEMLLDRVEGVAAVKDDWCGEFARRLGLLAHGRVGIFSGGQKQNHLNALPYGCDGYMSTFIKFQPAVAQVYWQAIETGDLGAAVRIVRELDVPLFDFIAGLPGGFDAGMHGLLEIHGIAGRWRRPPYHSLTDPELASLATCLGGLPDP